MKRFSFFAAMFAVFMILGCKAQVAETYTDNRVVEDGGSGPYKAIMVTEPSIEAQTIFRPADLSAFSKKNPLPILVWGNGACTNSPGNIRTF